MQKTMPRAKWWRFSLENPELCYGESLAKFLVVTMPYGTLPMYALIADVEGAGDAKLGIRSLHGQLIPTLELVSRLRSTGQIDWGNFYFVDDLIDSEYQKKIDNYSIAESISLSKFSLRVIDDSYLDIFTQDGLLSAYLSLIYPTAKFCYSLLDEMDYPD